MASVENVTEGVVRLSRFDQSGDEVYHRIALGFETNTRRPRDRRLKERLENSIDRVVNRVPFLAGTVRPVKVNGVTQPGQFEMAVTLKQVQRFTPVFHDDPFSTYPTLAHPNRPMNRMINRHFITAPDAPTDGENPVFVVQAGFPGTDGIIVVFYLHYAAADAISLINVIRSLSSDETLRLIDEQGIIAAAEEQNRVRGRLFSLHGINAQIFGHAHRATDFPPNFAVIGDHKDLSRPGSVTMRFHKRLVRETAHMLSQRRSGHYYMGQDVLIGILWKAATRALGSVRTLISQDGSDTRYNTSIAIPVDVRHIVNPPLDPEFFGCATVHTVVTTNATLAATRYELNDLEPLVDLVYKARNNMTDALFRSTIATANTGFFDRVPPYARYHKTGNLMIQDWTTLKVEEAHMGLNAGRLEWSREVGEAIGLDGFIIHSTLPASPHYVVTAKFVVGLNAELLADEGLKRWGILFDL